MITDTRPDTTPGRGRRIGLGILVGISPGLLLFAVNLLFIRGEAALSVGVGAIFLTLSGAVVGAVLGAQNRLTGGRIVIGAIVGALPGVACFFLITRIAPLVLIGGAILGGIIAGRAGPTGPSSPS